jgi:hypothetical protein
MAQSVVQARQAALDAAAEMPAVPVQAPIAGPSLVGAVQGMGRGLVAPTAQNNLFTRALNQHIGPAGQRIVEQVPAAVEGVGTMAQNVGNAVSGLAAQVPSAIQGAGLMAQDLGRGIARAVPIGRAIRGMIPPF